MEWEGVWFTPFGDARLGTNHTYARWATVVAGLPTHMTYIGISARNTTRLSTERAAGNGMHHHDWWITQTESATRNIDLRHDVNSIAPD